MPVLYSLLGVLGVVVVAVVLWATVLVKRQGPPAWRAFFETTGYRVPDVASEALEDHVTARLVQKGSDERLEGELDGRHLVFTTTSQVVPPSTVPEQKAVWKLLLDAPPSLCVEVCDRALPAPGALIKVAMAMKPALGKPFAVAQPTGRADFDQRFQVHATDPEQARALLASPGLADQLLSLGKVVVAVLPDSVRIEDPTHSTLSTAMAAAGGAKLLTRPFDYLQLAAPIHQRVQTLLRELAQKSRPA